MAYPPINIPFKETASLSGRGERPVLANWEPTSACRLTPVCGASCILTSTHANAGPAMPAERMEAVIDELIFGAGSSSFRHITAAAKEPTEASELMLRFARAWHSRPVAERALSIGMISASPNGIERLSSALVDSPLSFVLISVDTAASGLRNQANNDALLLAASRAIKHGGIERFGVNTTIIDMADLPAIESIGRRVHAAGAQQWTLASFCRPRNGKMEPVMALSDYERLIDWVGERFGGTGQRITLDLPFDVFQRLARPVTISDRGVWRLDHMVLPNVEAQTLPPAPGTFLRVRWDGELMALQDIMEVGRKSGRYGAFKDGVLGDVANTLRLERESERGSTPLHSISLQAA